ncbi:IS21 family transposase [Loigolactobacillus backii]|uniref:Uncharacterized protein n=1 Tax=Loigolactobacillus backii TaxID=375175 RepID=A0A192H1N5_9LACO|nr:IS21 family transposase [Loigolactobacillus backii]ANK61856.1 hypothetical protein AYR53_03170 [Loigolactobacillus backii]ANK68950.1 hypothetical protein AYR56_01555 [Loigolactobacillus backii]MDA5387486.1 IS21 family transposase [Loigolactobacillus backii]MDA5390030.1 IS21 family transposase [Loigolactobacillus backii]PIO82372.1 hypothetical protein BSQ39_01740 [Loigolactobacillus backii]
MKKLALYSKINELSNNGFSKRSIARQLGISRNTVTAYLDRDEAEMSEWLASTRNRKRVLDDYEDTILSWLKANTDMSAAQVCDWLEERNYGIFAESTVRRFVSNLRQKYKLDKHSRRRQYEAVPELPMGLQGQVDFGQTWQTTTFGSRIKLYFYAHVLAHSRYKYVEWQLNPFTTDDLIRCLQHTFSFFGGKPKQIVYDQDRIIVVSENNGDIIFTQAFQAFKQTKHFEAIECRGFDPETKGKIENVVKFVKSSFARGRVFQDLNSWNDESMDWLKRRGNGKQHNGTKQIPTEIFKAEQKYLQPITNYQAVVQELPERTVRKDNTIMYRSNRYSVPFGSYNAHGYKILLKFEENYLIIIDKKTGEVLAKHEVSGAKGKLIQQSNHRRIRDVGISQLMERVTKEFSDLKHAQDYIKQLHEKYPRYIRDQLQVILRLNSDHTTEELDQALVFCLDHHLISATDFKATVEMLPKYVKHLDEVQVKIPDIPISQATQAKLAKINPEVRSLDIYTNILQGVQHGTN